MLSNEYSARGILRVNPTSQVLAGSLQSLETARFIKQAVGIWRQNLRVLLGMAAVITSSDWQNYTLLLGAIKQLRRKGQELDSQVSLLIIPSPNFLVVGVVVIQTGEEIDLGVTTGLLWLGGCDYLRHLEGLQTVSHKR